MALFLLIETGTNVCSVALYHDTELLVLKENNEGYTHAQMLAPFIHEALQEQSLKISDLSVVAVSKGPGSYTGLRVGVSTAKGICFGANKPLIAVNSLRSLAELAIVGNCLPSPDTIIVPMIDARRMEVYTALFDATGNRLSNIQAVIIDETGFPGLPTTQPVLLIGNGVEKCKSVLQYPNIHYAHITSSATGMIKPAITAFENKQFVDVAYFEPFYLKDFVVTAAKKKVL